MVGDILADAEGVVLGFLGLFAAVFMGLGLIGIFYNDFYGMPLLVLGIGFLVVFIFVSAVLGRS